MNLKAAVYFNFTKKKSRRCIKIMMLLYFSSVDVSSPETPHVTSTPSLQNPSTFLPGTDIQNDNHVRETFYLNNLMLVYVYLYLSLFDLSVRYMQGCISH